MNCKKAETYLVEYLYQELSAKKTVAIEKHLRECEQCAKTLESWRAIHHGYQRTAEQMQPSPLLKQRLLVIAKEEMAQPPSFAERFLVFAKIAVVPILIFGILMVFNMQKKSTDIAENQKAAKPAPQVQMADQLKRSRQQEILPERRDAARLGDYDKETKAGREEYTNATAYGGKKEDLKGLRDGADEKQKLNANVSGELERSKKAEVVSKDQAYGQAESPAAPPAAVTEAPAQQEMQQAKPQLEMGAAAKAPQNEPPAEAPPAELLKSSMDDYRANKITVAVDKSTRAIKEDRSRALAPELHKQGVELQNTREYDKAIIPFSQVLANYPEYAEKEDVMLRLADSYERTEQYDNAIAIYSRLLKSPTQQKRAQQKISELGKKRETQQQLKSLGYVQQ
jgi:tetratricopeptide (TPR) repeat protein